MRDVIQGFIKQFEYYRRLGEESLNRVSESQLFYQPVDESNSLAVIAKHISGNMLSRWTDFLSTDGEKPWRHRDREFVMDWTSRQEVMAYWNQGWTTLIGALGQLTDEQLNDMVTIREQKHTVLEAIHRQLAHYPYRIGQMVYLSKMMVGKDWKSLSIPKGESEQFNDEKKASGKHGGHYTDGLR